MEKHTTPKTLLLVCLHLNGVWALPCSYLKTPNTSYRLLLTTLAELLVITPAVPNGSKWCHSLFRRTKEMSCKYRAVVVHVPPSSGFYCSTRSPTPHATRQITSRLFQS